MTSPSRSSSTPTARPAQPTSSTHRGWHPTPASSSGPISAMPIPPRPVASYRTSSSSTSSRWKTPSASSHHPKIEPYDGYLYLILHGIDCNATQQGGFSTHDIDFFIGRELPRHGPQRHVAVDRVGAGHLSAQRLRPRRRARWPWSTASSTRWSTTTARRSSQLEERLDEARGGGVQRQQRGHRPRRSSPLKRDVGSLRRVVMPQRDVVGPAGAPRVRRRRRAPELQVPRRPRPPRAAGRRGQHLPRSRHRRARRAPVVRRPTG